MQTPKARYVPDGSPASMALRAFLDEPRTKKMLRDTLAMPEVQRALRLQRTLLP